MHSRQGFNDGGSGGFSAVVAVLGKVLPKLSEAGVLDLGSGVHTECTVHGHRCYFSSWWEKVSAKLLGWNVGVKFVSCSWGGEASCAPGGCKKSPIRRVPWCCASGLQSEISDGWLWCIDCLLVGGTLWCVCWQSRVGQEENLWYGSEGVGTLASAVVHKRSGWSEAKIPHPSLFPWICVHVACFLV